MFPNLGPQRRVAKFLCVAALYQHHQGDDAAAIRSLRDARMLGATIGRQRGVVIVHLVVVGVDALATGAIEAIAPTLRVADTATGGDGVQREVVRSLIEELLDEGELRESWYWALCGERLLGLDTIKVFLASPASLTGGVGGGFGLGTYVLIVAPAFRLDAARTMEHVTATLEAGLAEHFPAARELLPAAAEYDEGIESFVHAFSRFTLPSLERALTLHFRVIALRRMAATALAMRLYEIDHGRRPLSLSELVPEYLVVLPADPFAADGRPIGYAPDAPQPVLYSINDDGVDDGGEFALTERGGVEMDAKDLVFFLNGDQPYPKLQWEPGDPNSLDAVDDQGDEVRDDWQADDGASADDEP